MVSGLQRHQWTQPHTNTHLCCTDPTTRFFDRSRRLLYFWPNVSTSSAAPEHGDDDGDEEEASELMSPPPSDGSLLAVWLPMLINVTATQEKPAKGISFRGIGFRDAAVAPLLAAWRGTIP